MSLKAFLLIHRLRPGHFYQGSGLGLVEEPFARGVGTGVPRGRLHRCHELFLWRATLLGSVCLPHEESGRYGVLVGRGDDDATQRSNCQG